ncbi:ribonuclease P protein component [Arthrobacter sp. Br18]|uniref:ribonuclease P protein component n=1 Tax=Arthrobacter sp. Br18 TaxID=1312954 RepID=UPI00047CE997|nr:ribonuclease P protein component [Arthrobacter sp. Br18]
MLPAVNRIRTAPEFSRTVRSGARSGRRNVVLYGSVTSMADSSRFGFIVGKNVGNAVTRNLVKRRLRAAAAVVLLRNPQGLDFVVRALPPSADAGWPELSTDLDKALTAVMKRLTTRDTAAMEGKGS